MKKKTPLKRLKDKCVARAIEIKLIATPICEVCNCHKAITAHHFVHQSQSNYLRCDQRNLISVCKICHSSIHLYGREWLLGQIMFKRGKKWYDQITKDSVKMIKDNLGYWKSLEEDLEEQLKK